MRNIKLTIQYDGTNYCGWQSQKNGIAIQDIISASLAKVINEDVSIIGAARTDAGVHAKGQVANFTTNSNLPLVNIKEGLNSNLPSDIVVVKIEEVNLDFHSQYGAKSKRYRYTVTTRNPVSPFLRNYVTPVSYLLDLDAMIKESKVLLGRYDFSSFEGSGSKRVNTIRTIYDLKIKKVGTFIYFDIEADGFLYNMARTIVGTLIDIGRGYFKRGYLIKILQARDRRQAGRTAPAKGLCLMEIKY